MSSGSGSSGSEGDNRRRRGGRNVRGRRTRLHQFLQQQDEPVLEPELEPEPEIEPEPLVAAPVPEFFNFLPVAPEPEPEPLAAAPVPEFFNFLPVAPEPEQEPEQEQLLPNLLPVAAAVPANIPEFPPFPLVGEDIQEDYFHLFKKNLSPSDITTQIQITGQNRTFFRDEVKAILCTQLENMCRVRLSLLLGDVLLGDAPVRLRVGNIGNDVTLSWRPLIGEHVVQMVAGQRAFGWFKWIEVVGPVGPVGPNELTVGLNDQNQRNYTMHIVIQIQP